MTFAAGALSSASITGTSVNLTSAVATGGTGPYTYQWYQSTVTGFSPGASTKVSGATALTYNPSGLLLGVDYFFVVVATDTGNGNVTANSSQLSVQLLTTPQASPSQNQFAMGVVLGQVDLRMNTNTIEVQFDPTGSGTLTAGQAVKFTTTAGGIPKVVPSTALADVVAGFVNYDIKERLYNPGDQLSISQEGNVIYLASLAGVNRGIFVTSSPSGTSNGGVGVVTAVTGSSGYPIVGYALDTIAAGGIGRIFLKTPAPAYAID